MKYNFKTTIFEIHILYTKNNIINARMSINNKS